LRDSGKRARFERLVLPHLDAAYNLAVWLMRDEALAEEAVQEACLRAFRFFDSLRGEEARPWLLGIVRNTSFTMLQRNSAAGAPMDFDENGCGEEAVAPGAVVNFPVNLEVAVLRMADREMVQASVRALPMAFREAVVLREIHGYSYREIAEICDVPIGTVMSRLARGRRLLQRSLVEGGVSEETGT